MPNGRKSTWMRAGGGYPTPRRVGLADVRIHDLRHSFASYVINAGHSLYEVQRLLGHTQVKTTQRHAHLSQESLLAAADTAALSVPWEQGTQQDKGSDGEDTVQDDRDPGEEP